MKRQVLGAAASLFLIVIFLISCKRDHTACRISGLDSSLLGNYELEKREGGNIKDTVFAAGNGNTLSITKTEINYFKNGQLIIKENYTSQYLGNNKYLITITNDPVFSEYVIFNNHELTFINPNPDVARTIYKHL